jgi:hypothetical protein
MPIQTVELSGERYVILSEKEFLEIQQKVPASSVPEPLSSSQREARYRDVIPLRVGGPRRLNS